MHNCTLWEVKKYIKRKQFTLLPSRENIKRKTFRENIKTIGKWAFECNKELMGCRRNGSGQNFMTLSGHCDEGTYWTQYIWSDL